jgi:hypothetical protein
MKNLLLFLLGIHTVFVMGCMTPTPSSLRQLNRYHANTSDKKFTVVHHFKKDFSIVYAPFYSIPIGTPDVTEYMAEQVALHDGDGVINLYGESERPFLLNVLIGSLAYVVLISASDIEPGNSGSGILSGVTAILLTPIIALGIPFGVTTFTLEGDIIKYKE